MVLITMTPAMVVAVQEYLVLCENDPSVRFKDVAGEPMPNEPAVGKPISHEQIIGVSKALLEHRSLVEGQSNAKNLDQFRLHHILRGSGLHVPPPKPKPEPTDEYKALMLKLRFDEEKRVYEKMLEPADGAPSAFQSAGVDSTGSYASQEDDDDVTYSEVSRQLALIINILVSIVACSCAIWMASSHWSTPRRLGLSLVGSGLVAVAEVVVYAGYLGKVKAAKERSRKRKETKTVTKTWVIDGLKRE